MTGRLKIALAGAGLMGRRHGELLAASDRAELSAVADPTDAGRTYADQVAVPCFSSLEAMLAASAPGTLDGVILATPNLLHVPGALACAAHGVSALIEKPLASSVAEGEQLLRALEQIDVPMLVGQHRRYSATLRGARAVIMGGSLGRLVSVTGSAQFHKPDSYFEGGPWRRQAGGGPILINLIHDMDNLRYLCGEVLAVHAIASNAVRGFEVEDTAVISLRFASGALGSFTLSDAAASPRSWEQTSGENPDFPRHPQEDCYFITGTQGSLALPTLRTWHYEGERSWYQPFATGQIAAQVADPLAEQLAHFCDVIERRAPPLVSVADALQSLRVVEAIRRSIETGAITPVQDIA